MTKKIYSMCMAVALLVAGVAMLGCKKDNNDPQEPAKVQTYKMSIQASKGTDQQANGPRKVLGLVGNTLNATWQAGEQVTVYNETQSKALTGYLEAKESGASVQLEGSLTGTVDAGDILTLKYLSANYTGQDGTIEYISEHCDYAVAENVEVEAVDGSTIYTSAEADFVNQQAIVKFTLKNAADHTTLLSPTALIFNDGTADIATLTIPAATYTTNGEGVLYVAVPGFSSKDITLTATVGSDTYTFNKTSTTLTNGQYYTLTVEMTKQAPPVPEGAISGMFSVSSTKQVYFSKGNLQLIAANTWKFADNQWDYFTSQSDNHRDLFGWGTNGTSGHNPNNTNKNNSEYSWAEWGTNTITNGGTGWRTLTADEWGYLIGPGNNGTTPSNQRANYQSLRGLCKITVSGTAYPGMIILPDDLYNHLPTKDDIPTKWAACAVEAGSLRYNTTFTEAEWTALQAAGAVFLPAAGIRSETTVSGAGTSGYYWSSSASSSTNAFSLYFTAYSFAGDLRPEDSYYLYYGCSVRLVKNAN